MTTHHAQAELLHRPAALDLTLLELLDLGVAKPWHIVPGVHHRGALRQSVEDVGREVELYSPSSAPCRRIKGPARPSVRASTSFWPA
jgi:hypothetical protein